MASPRPTGLRHRRRGVLAGAAAGLAAFVAAPQWWFPTGGNTETHWAAWQQAIGASYVILAATILLLNNFIYHERTVARPLSIRLTR